MVFTTEMNLEQPKYRVNAANLASHQGQGVCVLGKAHNQSQDGNSFQLTTSDGHNLTVHMNQPIQEYMEGLIEVQGMVTNQNNIQCHHYVKFDPEMVQNFDMESYDKAMTFINQCPEHYIQGVQPS